jgi:hypothetical protein
VARYRRRACTTPVAAIGAPGLPGRVESSDYFRREPDDDVGLQVRERVNPTPHAVTEEADRLQQPPVEVRLRPQERRVPPRLPEIAVIPGRPLPVVMRGWAQRLHHLRRDLLQQGGQLAALAGA